MGVTHMVHPERGELKVPDKAIPKYRKAGWVEKPKDAPADWKPGPADPPTGDSGGEQTPPAGPQAATRRR